ncbi:hypothetical protein KIPB_010625, partial [Kipferlia bialata]
GEHPVSHVPVVLKLYDTSDETELQHVMREMSVYSRVTDRHIVRCYGFLLEGDMCYVITGKCDCDLQQLQEKVTLSNAAKRHILRSMLDGITVLGSHSIIHRDIKPQNILINHDANGGDVGDVVLTDFDISKNEQDFFNTLGRTTSGTMHYIDMESVATRVFDHLSDMYSFGVVAAKLFKPGFVAQGGSVFDCEELSSADVALVNICLGPKKDRLSAYQLSLKGMFAETSMASAPAASSTAAFSDLTAELWPEVQQRKDKAPKVTCSIQGLLQHFTPPATPSLEGVCALEGGEEGGILSVLSALSQPFTIGGEQTSLIEPLSSGEYPLGPSIDACSLLQEWRIEGRDDLVEEISAYYAAFGRYIALHLLENPFPHGVLGHLVLAGLHSNVNDILRDSDRISHLFAATFPRQRRTLLNIMKNPTPMNFSDIPGCVSDQVLSEHNVFEFAKEFEYGYVSLLLEGVSAMRRGFLSLDPRWKGAVGAMSFEQFLSASSGFAPFTTDQYLKAFDIQVWCM